MQRYARLYVAFAKNSILNALEYRLSFTIWSIATICYAIVYVASIQFIFAHVQTSRWLAHGADAGAGGHRDDR